MENITSAIAVLLLLLFTQGAQEYKKKLLNGHYYHSIFSHYVLLLVLFVAMFFYQVFIVYLEAENLEALVTSVCIVIALGFLLQMIETKERTLLEYLWEKFPNSHKQMSFGMVILLAIPFVGIFAIQSHWKYGIYWFLGITAPHIIWVSVFYALEQIAKNTKVDEY